MLTAVKKEGEEERRNRMGITVTRRSGRAEEWVWGPGCSQDIYGRSRLTQEEWPTTIKYATKFNLSFKLKS